jgi:hypothetical protein
MNGLKEKSVAIMMANKYKQQTIKIPDVVMLRTMGSLF